MVSRKVGIAGFEIAAYANGRGAGLSLGLGGSSWRKLVSLFGAGRSDPSDATWSPGEPPAMAEAAGAPASASPESAALASQVNSVGWYHTLDLGHGVTTPGQFDHRELLPLYRIPQSVAGLRVLDVATFDGFWAFEFERRGAAQVIALDLDKPVELDFPPKLLAKATAPQHEVKFGRGFAIAKAALKSRVERVTCSVYDLDPGKYGTFDIVHTGDFLIHLNSPVRALQRIASVCHGYALISEVYSPDLDRPGGDALMEYRGGAQDVTWWRFSLAALEQMVLDAGFSRVEILAKFKYGPRGMPRALDHVVLKAVK